MPQLDRIIIFPQIFWLFIVFIVFYCFLTHFFLPRFLKVLKARKSIVEFNELELNLFTKKSAEVEIEFKKNLLEDLIYVKKIFVNNPVFAVFNFKKLEAKAVDESISVAIKNSMLFCNFQILNLIPIYCKSINIYKDC
uniref:Atp8 n=1 Tax=Pterocladia lucida TaxID=31408 RepID=A0A6M3WXS5_PTELU|nr:Atp8 [Pterocladia lucida]